MTDSKRPQEALYQIGIMQNVVFILVVVGIAFFGWATIDNGFTLDYVLWSCSLLTAVGFWYVGHRFSTHPDRSLLGTLRTAMVAYVVLWIAATVATFAIWKGEVEWTVSIGILLSAVATFLMVRITTLGGICVGHQVQPSVSRSPEYGRPVHQAGPQPGIRCPTCGNQLEVGTRFCIHDGTPIPQGCPSCGQVVDAGMRFCPHCGTPQSAA